MKNKRADKVNLDAVESTAPDVSRAAVTPVPGGSVSRIIRLNWKLIASIGVASMAMAWIIAAVQPKQYRASAIAAVAPLAERLPAGEVLRGVEVLDRRTVVATVAALASTPATRKMAAAGGGDYEINAVVLPNTNLFRVDVQGRDAKRVAAIANRTPEILGTQTRAMYKYYSVTIVSPATIPDAPFFPRIGRAVAAGLLIGLFLGFVAAYVLEWRYARTGRTQ